MSRSIKKGPYVATKLEKKSIGYQRRQIKEKCDQNLESSFNDHTGFCGPYICRA